MATAQQDAESQIVGTNTSTSSGELLRLTIKLAKDPNPEAEAEMHRAAQITGIPVDAARNVSENAKVLIQNQAFDPYGYVDKYPIADLSLNPDRAAQKESHIMPMAFDPSVTPYIVLILIMVVLFVVARLRRISLNQVLVTKVQRTSFLILIALTTPAFYILNSQKYLFNEIGIAEFIVIAWGLSFFVTILYKHLAKIGKWVVNGS